MITYTYEVTAVNATLGVMEVMYKASGYPDRLVGMPMPKGMQTLDDIVRAYAPVRQWIDETLPLVNVEVGASGTHEPLVPAQQVPSFDVIVNRATV